MHMNVGFDRDQKLNRSSACLHCKENRNLTRIYILLAPYASLPRNDNLDPRELLVLDMEQAPVKKNTGEIIPRAKIYINLLCLYYMRNHEIVPHSIYSGA